MYRLTAFSAQRLSASLRSTPPVGWATQRRDRGAQRLSASLRSTLGRAAARVRGREVLNAFRHHCGQHARVNRGPGHLGDVLNAFRHHCGQHSSALGLRGRRGQVLNAFRHHCGQHVADHAGDHLTAVCSTPFGITAVNTWPAAPTSKRPRSAQRLSASLRSTPGRRPR